MEVHKYYIKKTDTLVSIAQELGLSASDLKEFHNKNSKPHEWIKVDNTLPVWSEYIMIPDSVEVLKRKQEDLLSPEKIILKQKVIAESKYTILQKIDMQVSGNSMVDSETEIVWECSKNKNEESFHIDIKQKSHQVKYIKSIYRQLAEYMQKFNRPMEHLIIELFSDGNIKAVLNQNEIKETWNILKTELEPELGDTIEEKTMIEGGDKDFSNTLPLIKNNILYCLFLKDVYGEYLELNQFIETGKQEYSSQLFGNEKVFLNVKRKVEKDSGIAIIKFYAESDSDKNGHLREIYNTKLKDFLQAHYEYSLTWSVEYHIDIEKGKMILCRSKIKEQANSKYSHLMEHEIVLN
ncbi:LysM peptidoglycan-binding domain-containing protein [Chryseobacterium sp. G0186]|uniref:LysM peptidoglycan-binding domain-containing protein n=1 Tax=Chryseobacterium sp. G0186 TaxID=2487064 RepID=UPI000F4F0660|nr:LysM domain-containing protein [Chryseobacterium sp. G0186]AZA79544.1 LysM peptidoglycan-binding domain-containing protein [Chryseobacterium sp. G0186]